MNYPKKILILFITLLSACTSIPKYDENKTLDTLIQKPAFNYKINSLPKSIAVYFHQDNETTNLPDEVRGFLANSFFYNSNIAFTPKISLYPLKEEECNESKEQDLIIIFNLNQWTNNNFFEKCISNLNKTKSIYVTINQQDLGYKNVFNVSKAADSIALVQAIPNEIKRIAIVNGKNNPDSQRYVDLLQSYEKEIVENIEFNQQISSQDLFSQILLANRSNERKRKLSRRISKTIEGRARIRDDIDAFIFLVSLEEARNLKPALDYIAEKDFSVYLLNDWTSNSSFETLEKDLEGIITADFPIMITSNIPKIDAGDYRTREFAIGYDTYEILLLKFGAVNLRGFSYDGLSGKIEFTNNKMTRKAPLLKITGSGTELL